MRYGEVMRDLDLQKFELENGLKADPDVVSFIVTMDRTHRAEFVSHFSSWTQEERVAYESGDWKKFSRLRGYTEDEISDFENLLVQGQNLVNKYGEDIVWDITYAHQIQTGIFGRSPDHILTQNNKLRVPKP